MKEYINLDGVICWNDTHIPLEESELIQRDIEAAYLYFEEITTLFIDKKVQDYNSANGTKFNGAHSCANYRFNTGYTHQQFCERVWNWNVLVWESVRTYQLTITTIPPDTEFTNLLESVVF